MHDIVKLARRHVGASPDTVLDFFLVFARFEFALKRGGWLLGDPDAKADWSRFAREIDTDFRREQPADVAHAVRELLAHPPKKQVVKDAVLEWVETASQGDEYGALNVVVLIARVRNNAQRQLHLPGSDNYTSRS